MYNILEDNIEYHRKLGFERFYVLDRHKRHTDMMARHQTDWVDSGLVRYYERSPLESMNPSFLAWWEDNTIERKRGLDINMAFKSDKLDYLAAMSLCAHEHPYDRWMWVGDKDEFMQCSSKEGHETSFLMVRIILSSYSI
jgi:hypothetical protein